MSRRLGDDPLTRQRRNGGGTTRRPTASTSAVEKNAQAGTSAGSASYNSVFFQTRTPDVEGTGDAHSAAETQLVAETSTVPPSAVSAPAMELLPSGPSAPATVAPGDAGVLQVETEVTVSAASVAAPATQQQQQQATANPAEPPVQGKSEEQPREGGFFKKLFGRFQK